MTVFPYFENAKPFSKLMFFLFIILVSFILTLLIAMVLAIPLFGISFSDFSSFSDVSNPKNMGFLKYLQGVQTVGLFIIPSVLAGFLFHKKMFEYLRLTSKTQFIFIFLSGLAMLITIPLINFTAHINSLLKLPAFLSSLEISMKEAEESAKVLTEAFLNASSLGVLFVNLLIIAVLPALGEELIFRGVLLRIFKDWFKNPHVAIWAVAILFSFIHFQFYGFIPRMLMGALFGYLVYWSGNLWYSITAHFINNGTAVVVYYFLKGTTAENKPDTFGTELSDIYWVVLSGFLIFSILYYFRKVLFLPANKKS